MAGDLHANSVTDRPDRPRRRRGSVRAPARPSYDAAIRLPPILLAAALAPALAACGGDRRSTLPPAPSSSGAIALRVLSHHPEVYADATIQTVGTVGRARIGHARLFTLRGGGGVRIVLEPTAHFAHDLGRRVRVRGIFTVTFDIGYEILASGVTTLDR